MIRRSILPEIVDFCHEKGRNLPENQSFRPLFGPFSSLVTVLRQDRTLARMPHLFPTRHPVCSRLPKVHALRVSRTRRPVFAKTAFRPKHERPGPPVLGRKRDHTRNQEGNARNDRQNQAEETRRDAKPAHDLAPQRSPPLRALCPHRDLNLPPELRPRSNFTEVTRGPFQLFRHCRELRGVRAQWRYELDAGPAKHHSIGHQRTDQLDFSPRGADFLKSF
jgi:hypothetical protein